MTKPQPLLGLEAAWRGDVELLLSLYAPDCTFEDKALGFVHHGHDGVRDAFHTAFKMIPDFAVTYGDHVFADGLAVARWTFTGTLQAGGSDADQLVATDGVSFMTLRDGLIQTNVDFWNPQELAIDQTRASG